MNTSRLYPLSTAMGLIKVSEDGGNYYGELAGAGAGAALGAGAGLMSVPLANAQAFDLYNASNSLSDMAEEYAMKNNPVPGGMRGRSIRAAEAAARGGSAASARGADAAAFLSNQLRRIPGGAAGRAGIGAALGLGAGAGVGHLLGD